MISDLLTHWSLVRSAVSDQLDVPAHIMPHLVPEDHHIHGDQNSDEDNDTDL